MARLIQGQLAQKEYSFGTGSLYLRTFTICAWGSTGCDSYNSVSTLGDGRRMEKTATTSRACIRMAVLVGSCFQLASTGWLSWMRHVMSLVGPQQTEALTLVLGYAVQSLGIAMFVTLAQTMPSSRQERLALALTVSYTILVAPATLTGGIVPTLAFGYLANAVCGALMAYYLIRLALVVDANRLGTTFGCAYGASTVLSWLLSALGGGLLTEGIPCLLVCLTLTVLSILAICVEARDDDTDDAKGQELPEPEKHLLVLVFVTIAMVSLVKNAGYGFPAEDLAGSVNLELSRLLYGIGLVIAGIVTDYDRRVGITLCAASLALPFLNLSLLGAGAPPIMLWSLEYLLFGFFTVFRVTLASSEAVRGSHAWLAAAGMLFGRLGDAMGTGVTLWLSSMPLVHVAVTTMAFAVSMTLVFMLEQRLYGNTTREDDASPGDRDPLAEFCVAHGLSAREREVLPLLVAGKTNAEIATELFVTERTVKYHVHNIMEKTGCKSRLEVTDRFLTGAY